MKCSLIFSLGIDDFFDRKGVRVESHACSQFRFCSCLNAICGSFLVSDDAAGNVPARSVVAGYLHAIRSKLRL